MKLSINWLKKTLGPGFNLSPEELSTKLLHLGFEVSSIQTFSKCSGVVVSKILEIAKHPNADRLQIAKVTDGKEVANLVCGAPNIAVGQKIFWAKVGSVIQNGKRICESVIRGVPSAGMICSARELGVGEDHTGIWSLEQNVPLGSAIEELFNSEDSILEVEITPNRPDCLSMIGLAREIAAGLNLRAPSLKLALEHQLSHLRFPIQIENELDCFQYIAREFTNVMISPSPFYLQVFLTRIGIRPINNIVDVTNLVMLETGQPLHAFDADQLEGRKIVVRRAKKNEVIQALDGKDYLLDPEILVIADEKKPVAIAGIMGGKKSAVTNQTRNILLESAIFNKKVVRHGVKKLNLSSESSYRFERGVSQWCCSMGSAKAGSMISKCSGGKFSGFTHVSPKFSTQKSSSIAVRFSQIEKVLGEKVPPSEMHAIFQKLGVSILFSEQNRFVVQSPEWRLDLDLEIDYIEEIARLKGYEKMKSAGTKIQLDSSIKGKNHLSLKRKVRSLLQSLGFYESCNYGLVSQKDVDLFNTKESAVEIENPLSEDQSFLRPTLVLELFKNLSQNLSYQKKEIRLFEMGTVFQRSFEKLVEKRSLAGVACGKTALQTWQMKDPLPIDFFWIKGVVEKILAECHMDRVQFKKNNGTHLGEWTAIFHPSYFSEIFFGTHQEPIGFFGLVHPQKIKELGLLENTALFEINWESLEKGSLFQENGTQPIFRTPSIRRDCSIWTKNEVVWNDLVEEIKKTGGPILQSCQLFDLYLNPDHPDLKSLSFTLTFRDANKTLNEETANQLRDKIIKRIQEKFGSELRKRER